VIKISPLGRAGEPSPLPTTHTPEAVSRYCPAKPKKVNRTMP